MTTIIYATPPEVRCYVCEPERVADVSYGICARHALDWIESVGAKLNAAGGVLPLPPTVTGTARGGGEVLASPRCPECDGVMSYAEGCGLAGWECYQCEIWRDA